MCARARERERDGDVEGTAEWMRDSKKKTIRERHTEFHTPRLAERIVWAPNAKIQLAWKELRQLRFSQTFWKTFRKTLPPKSRYVMLKEC